MKILLTMVVLLTLSGCASYQKGEFAHVISGEHPEKTPITGYIDTDLTTRNYAVLHFNFGNGGKNWLRIKKARLVLDSKEMNNKANIVVGSDITTWAESIQHKISVDQWNRAMFLNSLAVVGAVAGGVSAAKGNVAGAAIGTGVMLGAATIQDVNNVIDKLNNLERSAILPRTHLYHPFSVPMGLYTKRWVLLQINSRDIPESVIFNVEYLDGKKASYRIYLGNSAEYFSKKA